MIYWFRKTALYLDAGLNQIHSECLKHMICRIPWCYKLAHLQSDCIWKNGRSCSMPQSPVCSLGRGQGKEMGQTNKTKSYINTTPSSVYSRGLFPTLYLIHARCLFIQYTVSALVVLDIWMTGWSNWSVKHLHSLGCQVLQDAALLLHTSRQLWWRLLSCPSQVLPETIKRSKDEILTWGFYQEHGNNKYPKFIHTLLAPTTKLCATLEINPSTCTPRSLYREERGGGEDSMQAPGYPNHQCSIISQLTCTGKAWKNTKKLHPMRQWYSNCAAERKQLNSFSI